MEKIAITTCVWKRIDITRACYSNLESHRSRFNDLGFDFTVYVCGSEEEHKELANEFGYKYVHLRNYPVGNKWEKVLRFSMKDDWDYWMTLGSDDFLLEGSADAIVKQMKNKRVHAGMPKNIIFFDIESGLGFEFKNVSRCGAARWYRRKVLDFVYSHSKNIYPSKNKSLDYYSETTIRKYGVAPVRFDGLYVADLKSEENINSFESLLMYRDDNGKNEIDINDFIPEWKSIKRV